MDEMPDYFLGCIVLIKKEHDSNSKVVDGQQRLTSLTILLSALRESVSEQEADDFTQFLYAKGNKMLGTENRYRLSVRSRDNEFFHAHIQDAAGIKKLEAIDPTRLNDSPKNMRDNTTYFLKRHASNSFPT